MDFALEKSADGALDETVKPAVDGHVADFCAAMDDDLNTADALSALFELVRDINKDILTDSPVKGNVAYASEKFDELTNVLGLLYNRKKETSLDDEVEALIAARAEARKNKNWAEADRIRDQIKAMGIILEDTPQGVKWKKA